MKILLIGPYPPPHGGVSVHVYEARRQLRLAGIECKVVNVDPGAPKSEEYVSIRGGLHLLYLLTRFARDGWTLHAHTNGHNHKSWLVALIVGVAARLGSGSLLTLHSGMAPAYLAKGRTGSRLLASCVCKLYRKIIAVSPEVREAVLSLGIPPSRVELLPAFLNSTPSMTGIPELREMEGRTPLLAITLSFRPEYGFELLVEAIEHLRGRHPEIACLVMGSGEEQSQAEQFVHEKNLQSSIYFLGNVSHEKCLSVISKCDIFVRPTLADGDANSVREALSLSIPVVASNVGNRPPGTVVFRTGDVGDLVAKIEQTWSTPRPWPNREGSAAATGNFTKLFELYRSTSKEVLARPAYEQNGKLARLRAMSAHEIGHRLREHIRLESERVQVLLRGAWNRGANHRHSNMSTDMPSPGPSCTNSLEEAFATRFYLRPDDRESVCRFVREMFPPWIEKVSAEAEVICDHTVELLGFGRVQLGANIDWNKDPITGTIWPQRYWADYDPVNETAYGDSKIVHELNRHQHLARLGKAYFLLGDELHAAEAIAQIDCWIEQNPEGQGINWQSSLEIAIRVLSWLWTFFFILPSKAFTEDFARRVTQSLLVQLRHVYRYPSTYTSPNTHLIGEAAVLFIAGSLFEGSAVFQNEGVRRNEATTWREFGADVLNREIDKQVLSDGVYGELSTYYHCYAVDFYLQALVLARRTGFEFRPEVSMTVERMLEFVMHITRPDGSIPLLGDDDGGRVLALDQQDYHSCPDGLCVGALLFNRSDFKRQAGAYREEALWLLGHESVETYETLRATAPSCDSHSFPAAGYFVQRSGWEKDDSHLVFDVGGLGRPSGGHGHGDALSLVLFSRGREILIDPGSCVYNAAPEWRSFFRSSRAHNTVVVDGQEQSEPAGTFQWQTRAEARVVRHFDLGGLEYAEGEHDGYERLSKPVSHKRRLLYCKPGYWIVVDELRGSGSHEFDFNYHFSPELALEVRDDPDHRSTDVCSAQDRPIEMIARAQDTGLHFFFDATSAAHPTVVRGKESPIQGWASSRYGAKQPATVLSAHIESSLPLMAATIMAPLLTKGENFAVPVVLRETIPGCALSHSINHGQYLDFLIVPVIGEEVSIAGFRLQGELFWLRTSGGNPQQLLGVGVRQMVHQETVLFDGPTPAEHILANFFEDRIVTHNSGTEDKVYVRDLRHSEVRCG